MRSKQWLGGVEPDPLEYAEWKQRADKAREEAAEEAAKRREGLKKTWECFVEWVPDLLESDSLKQAEKEDVRRNHDKLNEALRNLDLLLESISSPIRQNEICYLMTEAIWAANWLGRFSPPLAAISRMEREKQAEHMRHKRATNPKEIALLRAIAKHTNFLSIPSPAWTEATAILADVNRELAEQEYAPVKVDVVRRRLETFRAVKERTKS
jgi:hypothetical protein